MFLAGDLETVTVVQPVGKDNFGDPLPGSATEVEISGCLFAPGPSRDSRENLSQANQTQTDATLYAPPYTDITSDSRILIRGQEYEVVGEPHCWGAVQRGVEVPLRRVVG